MNSALLASFVLVATTLTGCAASSTSTDETASAASEINVGVTAGSFRLFDDRHHVTNPECESFTDLTLHANGSVHLVDGLGGRCALTADLNPNVRDYSLTVTTAPCGAKIYQGARRFAVGPAATGFATIKITDNRTNTCEVAVAAEIVVEEGGKIRYSMDGHPDTARIYCREMTDHGAEVTFFSGGSNDAIMRAVYTETSIIETTPISTMNVCSAHPVGPHDDSVYLTQSCNDVSWVNSYSVELYEGGFTGIPSIKLFRTVGASAAKELVHQLQCRYLTP